jgi:16S rRNA (guanine966-N2)-methyltransferase
MSIRVAGGVLGGRTLKTLPGRATRPTTGRVREAIFSILQHDIDGAAVLDIFAGSGALAIEALSRGAASAVLIEKHPRAAAVIKDNLKQLDLSARLIVSDYSAGLQLLVDEGLSFDLVFADPPYDLIGPDKLCEKLAKYPLLKAGAMLIMEHAGAVIPENERVIKTRRFGDSAISIFRYE